MVAPGHWAAERARVMQSRLISVRKADRVIRSEFSPENTALLS